MNAYNFIHTYQCKSMFMILFVFQWIFLRLSLLESGSVFYLDVHFSLSISMYVYVSLSICMYERYPNCSLYAHVKMYTQIHINVCLVVQVYVYVDLIRCLLLLVYVYVYIAISVCKRVFMSMNVFFLSVSSYIYTSIYMPIS